MPLRHARPIVPALLLAALALIGWGCAGPAEAATKALPAPAADLPAPATPGETRTAVLSGGCFWCVEAALEQLDGVSDVVSGYAGGTAETAVYDQVAAGSTEHVESVRVTYDPAVISYGELLRVFFTLVDPTTVDGQKPDFGRQYRTAVFAASDEQRRVAQAYIDQLTAATIYDAPIATRVEPLTEFYPAEAYHQDFVINNPDHPYVRAWAYGKIDMIKAAFPDRVKSATTRPAA